MEKRQRNTITILSENIVRFKYRNFSKDFNGDPYDGTSNTVPHGTIVIEEEKAKELADRGLNIKTSENRDGDTEYTLDIFARYDNFPPDIHLIIDDTDRVLDGDTIGLLDSVWITDIDLVISPSRWSFGGRSGVRAYVSQANIYAESQALDRRR